MSGGRGILGIGAGWYEAESRGMGVPFPYSIREKMGRFEETLKIAHHMWRDDRTTFKGRYYTLEEPICSPQPISEPHPYIMIGGGGEEKTLRYVARYGDACNLHLGAHPKLKGNERSYMNYRTRRERLTHKLDVLRMHCDREGRDYDEIDKSVLSPMEVSPGALTPGEAVGMCRELSEMGFNYVVFNMPNDHEITPIEVIGEEVIPEIMDL
jgi:alkanesulfonate monooxygenase SsuD/methylene tetrahydromethanopterin reductase-like flavin-dependent oxidoreductase (luciferase family)